MMMGSRPRPKRGLVVIVVVVTVVILALAAYSFCALMVTESTISNLNADRLQSRYLVDSGVEYTRLYLTQKRNRSPRVGRAV